MRSGTIVAALTAAALSGVGVLAWQASAARTAEVAHPGTPASASPRPGVAAGGKPVALPAGSGSGRRVVYSLAERRVWLVDADGTVARSYPVAPGTVSPAPGTYRVTENDRTPAIIGTDGTPVENVVLFTIVGGTVVGFSAAVSGAWPTPDQAKRTGGIREHLADGDAMWRFATAGTRVTVVR